MKYLWLLAVFGSLFSFVGVRENSPAWIRIVGLILFGVFAIIVGIVYYKCKNEEDEIAKNCGCICEKCSKKT